MDKNLRAILHLMIFCAIGLMTVGNPSDLYGQRRATTGAEEKDYGQEEHHEEEHHEIDPARFIEEMEEEFSRLETEWDRRREEINEHFEEWEAEFGSGDERVFDLIHLIALDGDFAADDDIGSEFG